MFLYRPQAFLRTWWDILDSEDYTEHLCRLMKIDIQRIPEFNYKPKENMFDYKTISKSDRKWFLCKNGSTVDLNQYRTFYIDQRAGHLFGVFASNLDSRLNDENLGEFDQKDKAKDYIKEIFDFLVEN